VRQKFQRKVTKEGQIRSQLVVKRTVVRQHHFSEKMQEIDWGRVAIVTQLKTNSKTG